METGSVRVDWLVVTAWLRKKETVIWTGVMALDMESPDSI